MFTRALFVLVLAVALLGGCSGSDSATDSGATGDGAGGEAQTGDGKEGDPCTQNSACQSGICYAGACARACTSPADCASGQDCTSDDGVRVFCNTPGYPKAVGQSCAVSGSCTAGTTCLGGVYWAHAYCTADCQTDVDCPATLYCREYDAGKKHCVRRLFCTHCYHDANCGPGKLCIQQGADNVCSRPCAAGSTECPRFAECKDVGGKHACVHKAGSCDGDVTLCKPCHNTDCQTGGFCLVNIFTQEQFCGQDCSGSSCPSSSYDCVGVGGADKQCVPHYDANLKQMMGCVQVSPIGQQGDVIEDFATVGYSDSDNNGSLVGEKLRVLRLSDYAGKAKIILFNLSAGWCGPCKNETQQFASLMATYGPKGLAIFQVLFDDVNPGDPPTVGLLDSWVSTYKPLGSVGIDVDAESIIYNTTGITPVNMILDANTRKVLDKSHGYSQTTLESKIKTHLGVP
jgi:thiol-disulfide isomerase/thioredoxin